MAMPRETRLTTDALRISFTGGDNDVARHRGFSILLWSSQQGMVFWAKEFSPRRTKALFTLVVRIRDNFFWSMWLSELYIWVCTNICPILGLFDTISHTSKGKDPRFPGSFWSMWLSELYIWVCTIWYVLIFVPYLVCLTLFHIRQKAKIPDSQVPSGRCDWVNCIYEYVLIFVPYLVCLKLFHIRQKAKIPDSQVPSGRCDWVNCIYEYVLIFVPYLVCLKLFHILQKAKIPDSQVPSGRCDWVNCIYEYVLIFVPYLVCLTLFHIRQKAKIPDSQVPSGRYDWVNCIYNIAFVNSERWLAKSRVDITTLCQHGKFPATLLLKFFMLYYKRNIKHFFRIDIQLYQHSWKLEKLEIVWKHSALRASCFHTISRFSNFHSCWYNCISTRKMFYIS